MSEWVRSVGGMKVTEENGSTGREIFPSDNWSTTNRTGNGLGFEAWSPWWETGSWHYEPWSGYRKGVAGKFRYWQEWEVEKRLQRKVEVCLGCTNRRQDPMTNFVKPCNETSVCGFLSPEDGTDRLSRNVGKKLPLLAAQQLRRTQFSLLCVVNMSVFELLKGLLCVLLLLGVLGCKCIHRFMGSLRVWAHPIGCMV